MADRTPVIACIKWGIGYPTVYANTLFQAVRDLTSSPFRFVCITDDPVGLAEGIETRPIPHFALERKLWTRGMWPKFAICADGMFEAGVPVLYLDLDVMVTGDLTPMIAHIREHGGLHAPQDWPLTHERWFPKLFHEERILHGAVIGFVAGEQNHLYDMVKDRGPDLIKEYRNDQFFFQKHAANRQYFPEPWVLSFKKSLAWHVPTCFFLEASRPPKDCMIVSFHGTPNPQDLIQRPFKRWGSNEKFGFFPVKWVKSYWERYSGE